MLHKKMTIRIFRFDYDWNDHTVPLSDAALQIVIAQIGKNPEYVFTLNGQKLKEVNTQAFRNALKRAGITDYRFSSPNIKQIKSTYYSGFLFGMAS